MRGSRSSALFFVTAKLLSGPGTGYREQYEIAPVVQLDRNYMLPLLINFFKSNRVSQSLCEYEIYYRKF